MNLAYASSPALNSAANWNAKALNRLEQAAEDAGLGPSGIGRVLVAWLGAQCGHVRDIVLSVARDSAVESDGCDRASLDGMDFDAIAREAGWDEADLGEVLLEAASFVSFDPPALEEMVAALARGAADLARAPG